MLPPFTGGHSQAREATGRFWAKDDLPTPELPIIIGSRSGAASSTVSCVLQKRTPFVRRPCRNCLDWPDVSSAMSLASGPIDKIYHLVEALT
jgi:hypothetical protein